MNNLLQKLKILKNQQPKIANLSLKQRNQVLKNLSVLLYNNRFQILKANQQDLKNLRTSEMRDRLALSEKRLKAMADGLLKVANLPDFLNKTLEKKKLPNGLILKKIVVPLGVVGVIYESRPNVTIDLTALAVKSGNALVLKGGSEAYYSNKILVNLIHIALKQVGLSKDIVFLINPKSNWQEVLLNAREYIDVLIPRGSQNLITWVRENSKLPIIETGAGVCHILVDGEVDAKKAADIIVNAKVQRPDVCNALDTLVIHKKVLNRVFLLASKKLSNSGVKIFADRDAHRALKILYPNNLLHLARPKDYGHEFLSLQMSIKTVKTFEQGMQFVKANTSGHSEAILSSNKKNTERFLKEIDAACVYANASTRFTDGQEFGMGAEVGISTQKLHARGPMGFEALTSYKWVVVGKGQVRK